MRFRPRPLPLALAALLGLSGCARHSQGVPSDNTLRVPMPAPPTTFDPAMATDGNTIDLLQQVFEGLVQWTPQNTLAPALAARTASNWAAPTPAEHTIRVPERRKTRAEISSPEPTLGPMTRPVLRAGIDADAVWANRAGVKALMR